MQRALVEAPVVNRLATEAFDFVAQMQNAALEISYHQVVRRRTGLSLSGLLFESFLPLLKMHNMVRLRHDSLQIEKERARYSNVA